MDEIARGQVQGDLDILMRTGFDAVHTQGAVEVADLLGQVELQLASALGLVTANAIFR